jgi:penicillin-binding protein 2
MEPRYRLRIYLLTALIMVGFGALLTRLHEFQIERRDEFLQLVPGNRTVTVREPGIRGEITDRNGIPLAQNLRNYEVSFNLEEIYRAYRAQHMEDPTIERLTQQGGHTRLRSEKDIVSIVQDTTLRVLAEPELDLFRSFNASTLRTHYLTHGGLVPFSYRTDLTYEEFARFAEHNLDLPGVYLSTRPQRHYPYGTLASHVLGYLKQWEKGDVPEAAARRFNHYIGEDKGIAGVEATMDEILRGPEGRKSILKDEKGRTIGLLPDYTKPGIGARVELTLDARIQYLLENTLRRAGRAAGVVMDVNTGEVLAMASVPDYDPNAFIPSISAEQWKAYNENKLSPFTNRAIASFTPGSTMKIPTAIAGALQGMANRSFSCDGYVAFGNHRVGCWLWNKSKGRHGSLNLERAIQQSCNPYFNRLANTIGFDAMVEGCQMVGIGRRTGVELPKEDPGILPGSRTWRSSGAVMTPALNAMLSIGQGDSMASPLQLCAVAACVANGGKYYQPRVVRKAVAENGDLVLGDLPKLEVDLIEAGIKPADFEHIRKGMWMAVNQPGGTASRVRIPNIDIAAKTGTAQTVDDGKKSNNSWVISFAPYENPRYAICIMVQNASSGGAVCGPLVNLVYRGIFAQEEGLRLPLRPQTEFVGNLDRIEEIELPKDILAAIDVTEEEDVGETGAEVDDFVPLLPVPEPESDTVTPTPTITPEADAEGSVIPRAIPVEE